MSDFLIFVAVVVFGLWARSLSMQGLHCIMRNLLLLHMGFPGGSVVNLLAMLDTRVQSLSQEDPLEEEMATHSSILVWEIPWKKEPGGLQPASMHINLLQLCPTLCDPMDCSPPGSSVHGGSPGSL